ncbi:MAG: 2-aminoethylphosphonate--pyruvate transaminase [bacterium]
MNDLTDVQDTPAHAASPPAERGEARDPWLLTPGPLTTSTSVKAAMLHDWGSRDASFIAMTARVRARLTALVHATSTHECVPIQGSGTFVVEATLGTLVPRDGKALVLVNGAYGERIAEILARIGRRVATLEWEESAPVDPLRVDVTLADDLAITHVVVVHCETTTGLLNPLPEVAAVVARHGRRLIVDAMSAFGALEVDARSTPFDALVASSNKCLEGVPGIGFAIVRRDALAAASGQAHSVALDLHAQWRGLEANGQWRFTPPTHVLAALDRAIEEHVLEGGVAGRGARYRANCAALVTGMRALGFETFLPDALQAPIIVTFHRPADPRFDFEAFYGALRRRGFVIYPGKLTQASTFRMGCIGRIGPIEIGAAVAAVRESLAELGVASGRARTELASHA